MVGLGEVGLNKGMAHSVSPASLLTYAGGYGQMSWKSSIMSNIILRVSATSPCSIPMIRPGTRIIVVMQPRIGMYIEYSYMHLSYPITIYTIELAGGEEKYSVYVV